MPNLNLGQPLTFSFKCVNLTGNWGCDNVLSESGINGSEACKPGICVDMSKKYDRNITYHLTSNHSYSCDCDSVNRENDVRFSFPNCFSLIHPCRQKGAIKCENGFCKYINGTTSW